MDEPIVAPAEAPAPEVAPVVPAPAPAPEKPEVKPELVEGEQPEVGTSEPVVPAAPYELKVPDFIPLGERTPEREAYISEFAQVAAEAGLESRHPGLAQALLDQAVEAATTLGVYTAPDEHTTAEDAFQTMGQMFGKDGAGIVADAQKTVRALGPQFAAYLDRTGLGNDPAVLVALSQAGYLGLSPEQAREQLAATMQTKEYRRGDKAMVLKVGALSRIANRTDENESLQALEEFKARQAAPTPVHVAGQGVRGPEDVALREEAAKLASKHGGMSRVEADRFMTITKRLSGGA